MKLYEILNENLDDDDLTWGDELIEDLKLLLDETEKERPAAGAISLKNGVVDLMSQYDGEDEDLTWGDELIEDLKLLLDEMKNERPAAGYASFKRGLIDLISQYDREDD